jgi:putative transposase
MHWSEEENPTMVSGSPGLACHFSRARSLIAVFVRLSLFMSQIRGSFRQRCHRVLQWTRPMHHSLLGGTLTDLARSRVELLTENALLRQQLIILRRQVKRPACSKSDRILLVLLARAVRRWKQALFIVQPETLLNWHCQAFRWYWRQRSKPTSRNPKSLPRPSR